MKKLDLYILKQIAVPAGMSIMVISFLAVATRIRRHYDDMPIELLSFGDMARLCIFFLPPLAVFILPITYLMGIVWAMGQLTQSDELTAMKASGISVKRISLPIILGGVALSGCCFWMQNYVQPWGITKAFSLIYLELPQRMTLDNLPSGEMHDYEGWRVYFRDKDVDNGTLLDIDIIKPEVDGIMFVHASSAVFDSSDESYGLTLEKGYTVLDNGIYTHFDSLSMTIPAPSPKRATSASRYALSITSLFNWTKELRTSYEETGDEFFKNRLIKIQEEIAGRFSAPFAALVMALVAAPLSVRSRRKGHAVGFMHGAAIIVVYYILTNMVEIRTMESLEYVMLLAWIPNGVMLLAGLTIYYRSDSI